MKQMNKEESLNNALKLLDYYFENKKTYNYDGLSDVCKMLICDLFAKLPPNKCKLKSPKNFTEFVLNYFKTYPNTTYNDIFTLLFKTIINN